MCLHPKICTTCNIQVLEISVNNYSIILGIYWNKLKGVYYSMGGIHVIIPRGTKNIILYREYRIVPYIENAPQPVVTRNS